MENKNYWWIIAAALAVFTLFYTGCEKRDTIIVSGSSEFTSQWVANYSETISGVDWEGDFYTETDYWTEEASSIYFVLNIDGIVSDTNSPDVNKGSKVFKCKSPDKWKINTNDYNFDNFSLNESIGCRAMIDTGEEMRITFYEYKKYLAGTSKAKTMYFFNLPCYTKIK